MHRHGRVFEILYQMSQGRLLKPVVLSHDPNGAKENLWVYEELHRMHGLQTAAGVGAYLVQSLAPIVARANGGSTMACDTSHICVVAERDWEET